MGWKKKSWYIYRDRWLFGYFINFQNFRFQDYVLTQQITPRGNFPSIIITLLDIGSKTGRFFLFLNKFTSRMKLFPCMFTCINMCVTFCKLYCSAAHVEQHQTEILYLHSNYTGNWNQNYIPIRWNNTYFGKRFFNFKIGLRFIKEIKKINRNSRLIQVLSVIELNPRSLIPQWEKDAVSFNKNWQENSDASESVVFHKIHRNSGGILKLIHVNLAQNFVVSSEWNVQSEKSTIGSIYNQYLLVQVSLRCWFSAIIQQRGWYF